MFAGGPKIIVTPLRLSQSPSGPHAGLRHSPRTLSGPVREVEFGSNGNRDV